MSSTGEGRTLHDDGDKRGSSGDERRPTGAQRRSNGAKRRWLAPEIVQTSPMDCGPAALKCLLEGFGVEAAYGRLREACQTDVDGTSIDVIESVARTLGLDATQILAPVDHVAAPRAATLPALIVVRLPSGANHFVIAWRRIGARVQVMDPASGRRWMSVRELRQQAYEHAVDLEASTWRGFATSHAALVVLEHTLAELGCRTARTLIEGALGDASWRSIAALDAAARMTRSLVEARGVRAGAEAARLLQALFEQARTADLSQQRAIPAVYWTVRPHAPRADGSQLLHVRGALLVRVRGRLGEARAEGDAQTSEARTRRPRLPLSPELRAALTERPARAAAAVIDALRSEGLLRPGALALFVCASAALVIAQALLFRALFDLGAHLALDEQRLVAGFALVLFVAASVALELPLAAGCMRLGRQLEARLRIAFQEKLPRLSERYFASRPTSDMAERAHSLVILRDLPTLAMRCARTSLQLCFTAAALVWLDPACAGLVIVGTLVAIAAPFAFQRSLSERELALRSHHGALSRFYLDALLGLVAVRVHGAEASLRREHESLLVEWVKAGRRLLRSAVFVRAACAVTSAALAGALVIEHARRGSDAGGALLFGYWALGLPALGEQLAQIALQLPAMRNATLRAIEPLGASEDPLAATTAGLDTTPAALDTRGEQAAIPEIATHLKAAGASHSLAPERSNEQALSKAVASRRNTFDGRTVDRVGEPNGDRAGEHASPERSAASASRGVAIEMHDVALTIGGHAILGAIELSIRPGEHVALVGRSGAGKTSLIGLLLGVQRCAAGELTIDGRALDAVALRELRGATAWVDPSAQLWNRSLFENLIYGSASVSSSALVHALSSAELEDVFETLPQGLETTLGEGGTFLSGGEGQRVRFARAWLRGGVRLALLDEPFRGLERARRGALLARAREHWRAATLVCATHDLEETLGFDRVVVLERGRIVESGNPRLLAARASSHFAQLLTAERALREELWNDPGWIRWRVEDGRVHAVAPLAAHTPTEERS